MQPFLKIVAQQLHDQYKDKMHQLAVVFPNRRQSVYFSYYLQQVAAPPCFMPQLLTIEELVASSATLPMADNLTQGFALYEAFAAVSRDYGDSNIPPFDVFFSIGETLLKDFREIDSYLVDIESICKVLYDIEAIDKAFDQLSDEQREFLREFWRGATSKGAIQEKFLKLWERLPAIHQRFLQLLEVQQLTTMGQAYRALANGQPANPNFCQQWMHVAFVGFNAFNKAEETFIKKWNDEGYASLWFDADSWYVQQPQQEAGFFLRRNFNFVGLRNELDLRNDISTRTDSIDVIATEGQHAQAKQITPWWQTTQSEEPLQAAILLADETLLLPVLQSLPPSLDKVNITMGYPLQQSPVYAIIRLFFEVQHDLQKHRFQSVHHSLVSKWLLHPFCNWPLEAIEDLQQQMQKENLVQVPVPLLTVHCETASLLFSRMMADMEVFQRLRRILERALEIPAIKSDSLMQGLCVAAWKTLQQLQPLFAVLKPPPELDFIGSLLLKQIGSISVPFEGEPLEGVQIMGLLESRGLDFDHLIILGANEGSLPRIKPPDSFLPDNVRRAFGLPVPEHQDAIFAYVFYRLLHRSQSIRLVYNALVTDNSTGEVSRFVKQLEFETKIPIRYTQTSLAVSPKAWPSISINKSKEVMNRLYVYFKPDAPQTISPSAINTYLNCRLQFFFRYIARIEAPEELEEGVEANAVGSVVHKLLELLYDEWMKQNGNQISAEAIAWMQKEKEMWVEQAFRMAWRRKEIKGTFQFSGELHIVRAIVLEFVDKLLQLDAAYAPFILQQTEIKLSQPFGLQIEGKPQRVLLSGYVDRIDEKDGLYRMADYKTGGDNPVFESLDALFERDGKKHNKAALQTLIYSWMFHKQFPQHARFEPALLAVRHLQKNEGQVQLQCKEDKANVTAENIETVLINLEPRLRQLLEELFDPSIPFDQTAVAGNCQYCDFAGICRR